MKTEKDMKFKEMYISAFKDWFGGGFDCHSSEDSGQDWMEGLYGRSNCENGVVTYATYTGARC